MIALNTIMALMIGAICLFDYEKSKWIDDPDKELLYNKMLYFAILLLNTLILALSVVKIRSLLRSLHNAFPNEKFIAVHVLNSGIYTFLFLVVSILMMLQIVK